MSTNTEEEFTPALARVEIHDNEQGQWFFRAIAENNEIVASGEMYTRKESCVDEASKLFPGVEMIEVSSLRHVEGDSRDGDEQALDEPEDG